MLHRWKIIVQIRAGLQQFDVENSPEGFRHPQADALHGSVAEEEDLLGRTCLITHTTLGHYAQNE